MWVYYMLIIFTSVGLVAPRTSAMFFLSGKASLVFLLAISAITLYREKNEQEESKNEKK